MDELFYWSMLAAFFTHELDAVKRHEWRILPLTSFLPEKRQNSRWGRIDCLVNNAGVADFKPIEETNFESWRRVMATNLDGVFLCSQAAELDRYLRQTAVSRVPVWDYRH